MPRDQIEEMGVPSYGLEEVGLRGESFGDYRAELIVTGSDAELRWFDANGKPLKSVPAKVKGDHKDELKELQQSLKDIQAMLPAQRDRIDAMFLQQKTWPIAEWRERYLDHPLVGTIARRLIWCVDGTPALFVGRAGDRRAMASRSSTARRPRSRPGTPSAAASTRSRPGGDRLEELGITQPFKQAHREVYLLTDAERNTRDLLQSLRGAHHPAAPVQRPVRGPRLEEQAAADGRRQLSAGDAGAAAVGPAAEFWIEGVGDEYGTDTNESGVFLRLATDQVRFYRTEAARNWAHAGGGGYDEPGDRAG